MDPTTRKLHAEVLEAVAASLENSSEKVLSAGDLGVMESSNIAQKVIDVLQLPLEVRAGAFRNSIVIRPVAH